MNKNYFLREVDFYKRNINPIKHYVKNMVFYLNKMTDKSKEECKDFVLKSINDKQNSRDPVVTFLERDNKEDRVISTLPLNTYIKEVINKGEILAPTFTTYLPTSEIGSTLVDFMDNNTKIRDKAKKEGFIALAKGDLQLATLKEKEEANKKINNNSVSGAFQVKSCPLYNPTSHNTLTSTTRSVSSISNSSNEKIVSGNRHYYNPEVILNNIIFISSVFNREELDEVIQSHNLVYPSVEDVMECIYYSSDLYFTTRKALKGIEDFVLKLDKLERASIVYIGDFFHIRKLNPSFVRELLRRFSLKEKCKLVDDPLKIIEEADEEVVNLSHLICKKELKGKGKRYQDLDEEVLMLLGSVVNNINEVIYDYKDFIKNIFLTEIIPSSSPSVAEMNRRTVVLSHTDSTMFSVDEYVIWYFGSLVFTEEAYAVAGSVMFIASQSMSHILAMLSANMAVEKKKLHKITMKPEFGFSVFASASVKNHYYTDIYIREGDVMEKPIMKIMGKHFKGSDLPKTIVEEAQKRMGYILNQVKSGGKVSIRDELNYVLSIEDMIFNSIVNGEPTYFITTSIKEAKTYKLDKYTSPYRNHIFWMEIFSSKYKELKEPPYSVIKIPTILITPLSLKQWIDGIEDPEIKTNIISWLDRNKKKNLPTIYLNKEYVNSFGIPKELIFIINIRKIILELTNINRIILNTVGYFPKSKLTIRESEYGCSSNYSATGS